MRIYIDMDGVITDFKQGQEYQGYKLSKRPDLVVNYRTLPVMEGAIKAVAKLNADHEIFIASTPPWTRPEVWGHKREWLEEHFPYLKRKLILTHRKDLLIGDVLIDDTRFRGQPDFKGNWFWFNKDWSNRNWNACLEYIKTLEKDYEKV
jgi:5'(3')-deoxyribonucleotidase